MQASVKQPSGTRSCLRRSASGTAIAEFGPGFAVLVLMIFFPLVDMLGLGASYASCTLLNYCQLREAAFCSKDEALAQDGPVKSGVPQTWRQQGVGKFANLIEDPKTEVNYVDADDAGNGVVFQYVQVSTSATASPFLAVPFFAGVPGLGAPVTFKISSERLLENTVKKS